MLSVKPASREVSNDQVSSAKMTVMGLKRTDMGTTHRRSAVRGFNSVKKVTAVRLILADYNLVPTAVQISA